MNRDDVTELVEQVSRAVAAEPGMTEAAFPVMVYGRLQEEHPEAVGFIRQESPAGLDVYQALKWYLPDDLGFETISGWSGACDPVHGSRESSTA